MSFFALKKFLCFKIDQIYMPPKKQKKNPEPNDNQPSRSKWNNFNKTKVTFITKNFRSNLTNFKHMISWLQPTTGKSHEIQLAQWFLGLPTGNGRCQELVCLAFIHNYSRPRDVIGNLMETKISQLENNKNPFYKTYLELQNIPEITIHKINDQRKMLREVLKMTDDKILKAFIRKKHPRGLRVHNFTRRNISQMDKDQHQSQLRKFFFQLTRQPPIQLDFQDPSQMDKNQNHNSQQETNQKNAQNLVLDPQNDFNHSENVSQHNSISNQNSGGISVENKTFDLSQSPLNQPTPVGSILSVSSSEYFDDMQPFSLSQLLPQLSRLQSDISSISRTTRFSYKRSPSQQSNMDYVESQQHLRSISKKKRQRDDDDNFVD